jgi:hypothetical protein
METGSIKVNISIDETPLKTIEDFLDRVDQKAKALGLTKRQMRKLFNKTIKVG